MVHCNAFYKKLLPSYTQGVFLLSLTILLIAGCKSVKKSPRFELLSPEKTHIDFANMLEERPDFNILNYLYFYDGGGVSIGDVNNDGLPDIYFTANMLSNRLYINKGDMQFEDITKKAGVAGHGEWTTGTTMADVNGDGLLDMYVCNVNYMTKKGRNQLFINNGDSTFTDRAKEYGLDFEGYSKQAAFFDYDNDGDLDMYLLNHSVHSKNSFARAEQRSGHDPKAGDRLFRNDGSVFTDVTDQAGIYSSSLGYGLAVSVGDLNGDGCTDIYVSNDFHENDYLYRNNCDGTFDEVLQNSTGHTSRASMGSDISDFNNDGKLDIMVLDMLPSDERTRKTAVISESYQGYKVQRDFGYHPQLIRNTLQLNMGNLPKGEALFSEISQLAGVSATDWSWSPLFFDMDNDGKKDLFISNGIYRRPNDLDYLGLTGVDQVRKSLAKGVTEKNMALIAKMPHSQIPNAVFKNEGNLSFTDHSDDWGFEKPTYSSGAAYGDLDNDGDLDLVVNNVNMPAYVYQNETRESGGGNYLKIKLSGISHNTLGIGGKVRVYSRDTTQLYQLETTRAFQSSVEPQLLVGIGQNEQVDSVSVTWPDGKKQTLSQVKANQTLEVKQSEATGLAHDPPERKIHSAFGSVDTDRLFKYKHEEDAFIDFDKQPLAPHSLSGEGPRMAVGDVNGDGLSDFYICGAKWQSGALFVQQKDGSFVETNSLLFKQDNAYEDVDAVFVDVNNDGAEDLYVVSGGNEYPYSSKGLEDRIYFNDGNGKFARIYDALPSIYQNGGVVAPADYDGDGDMDLFIGNRSVPQNYGANPNSYLLENDGRGRFSVVPGDRSPGLQHTGMVSDALWVDLNGDRQKDLIVVGEWMPITIFINDGGKLQDKTADFGLGNTQGWWNRIAAGDFDGDGDMDFIAGNLGLNSGLQASQKEPLVLYVKDFNDDGQVDPIMGYTREGSEYPFANRDDLLRQFDFLRSKYPKHESYAGQTIQDIFGDRLSGNIEEKKAVMMQSVYLENSGAKFEIHDLPEEVQFSSVRALSIDDYDNDGNLDVLAVGNSYKVQPALGGRVDASFGWFLQGDGNGHFIVHNPLESGFFVKGQSRDIRQVVDGDGKSLIIVARNDDSVLVFEPMKD